MSVRANFFSDNNLYISLMNLDDGTLPKEDDSVQDPSSSTSKNQNQPNPTINTTETHEADVKNLKATTVSRIRAFASVGKRISQQKQFTKPTARRAIGQHV